MKFELFKLYQSKKKNTIKLSFSAERWDIAWSLYRLIFLWSPSVYYLCLVMPGRVQTAST